MEMVCRLNIHFSSLSVCVSLSLSLSLCVCVCACVCVCVCVRASLQGGGRGCVKTDDWGQLALALTEIQSVTVPPLPSLAMNLSDELSMCPHCGRRFTLHTGTLVDGCNTF